MFPDLTRDDVFRLETARLWLRWPRVADADTIARLAGEKAVAEMTALIPHPYPDGGADDFILAARRGNSEGAALTMVVTPRTKPGTVIGTVRIGPGETGAPELGFWIGAPCWDKGFATEAARAIVDAYFRFAQGEILHAQARTVNPASRRVLEKLGFARQGSGSKAMAARGGVFPVDTFLLTRAGWLESAGPLAGAGRLPAGQAAHAAAP